MTYIVDEQCVKCKLMDCVEVCPVDCFYEGENTLVIHPDECIDCGVCEPECPVAGSMPENVGNAISSLNNITSIKVNLIWHPKWSKKMMSEDAKLALDVF